MSGLSGLSEHWHHPDMSSDKPNLRQHVHGHDCCWTDMWQTRSKASLDYHMIYTLRVYKCPGQQVPTNRHTHTRATSIFRTLPSPLPAIRMGQCSLRNPGNLRACHGAFSKAEGSDATVGKLRAVLVKHKSTSSRLVQSAGAPPVVIRTSRQWPRNR